MDSSKQMKNVAQDMSNPILDGVIWKQLLLFFFPILLGSFFQQLYNTIDSLIVGNFVGTSALAAVGGSTALIVSTVVGFFTGLSAGAGVIISQHYGAGHAQMVSKAVHTAFAFSIIGGIVLSIVGMIWSPALLRLMNQPEDIMADSTLYLRIYFAGLLFIFIFNSGSGIIRALGNSRLPLYFLIICSLVNVALDLILVVGFQLGVMGVAIATLLAQAVSAFLVTRTLMKGVAGVCLSLHELTIDAEILKKQLYIGIPSGLQTIMYSIANMLAQTSVNSYGTKTVAGWTADGKIETIFWMMSGAFGVALTTFVGQNYGAGKKDRVRKATITCLLMMQICTIILSALFVIFAWPLQSIFTSDQEALAVGSLLMKTVAPFYIFYSFVEIFSGTLRGIGDVIIPTLMILTCMCLFRIGWLSLILPRFQELHTIMIMYPITWTLGGISFILYYAIRSRKMLMMDEAENRG